MVESEPSSYFDSQYLDISIKLLMNLTLSKPIVTQNHNPSINQSIHSSLWYPTPALTSVCLRALSLQLNQSASVSSVGLRLEWSRVPTRAVLWLTASSSMGKISVCQILKAFVISLHYTKRGKTGIILPAHPIWWGLGKTSFPTGVV